MFRFTIRELVLLTLVVAMGVGWWLEHSTNTIDWKQRDAAIRHVRSMGGVVSVTERGDGSGEFIATAGFENGIFTKDAISALQAIPDLRIVIISGPSVDDEVAMGLSQLTELEDLELIAPQLTDKGACHLAKLGALQRLSLTDCKVGDIGGIALSQLQELRELNLRGTQLGDEGFLAISNRLHKLRRLDVRSTPVSEDALERATAQRPNLWISHQDGVRRQSRVIPGRNRHHPGSRSAGEISN